jgi:predicted nuclease of predicted toxin-antitoxin system
MSKTLASTLQGAGHPAEHVTEVGLRGQPDTAVFAYAQAHQQTIITGDLGLGNVARYPPPHFGILVSRLPDTMPLALRVQEVINALARLAGQDFANILCIIEPGRVRIRR